MLLLSYLFIISFVLVPPRITPFAFEDSPINAGEYATIQCIVPNGDLPISISWKVNEDPVENHPDISLSKVGRRGSALTIESISYSLTGNFTCLAVNSAGISQYTTLLQVNG